MNLDTKIHRARQERTRRERLGLTARATVITGVVVTMAVLPHKSPMMGVAVLALAAATAVLGLWVDGRDDLQIRRAVLSFAIGGACGALLLAADAVRVTVTGDHAASPGRALSAIATGWLISEAWFRVTHGSDDDA